MACETKFEKCCRAQYCPESRFNSKCCQDCGWKKRCKQKCLFTDQEPEEPQNAFELYFSGDLIKFRVKPQWRQPNSQEMTILHPIFLRVLSVFKEEEISVDTLGAIISYFSNVAYELHQQRIIRIQPNRSCGGTFVEEDD